MGYTYDFKDNVTYGCDDINGIRREIMTAGVGPYADSCKVVAGSESGTVKITSGSVLFNDGSRIVFDNTGETLPITQGQKQYIYVVNDDVTNTNYPVVSGTAPTTGDYVMLAEVAANGTITDRRVLRQIQYSDMAPVIMPIAATSFECATNTVAGTLIHSVALSIASPSYISLTFPGMGAVEFFPKSNIVRVAYTQGSGLSATIQISSNLVGFYNSNGSRLVQYRLEVSGGKLNFYVSFKSSSFSRSFNVFGYAVR